MVVNICLAKNTPKLIELLNTILRQLSVNWPKRLIDTLFKFLYQRLGLPIYATLYIKYAEKYIWIHIDIINPSPIVWILGSTFDNAPYLLIVDCNYNSLIIYD